MKVKFLVEYSGKFFSGWQTQDNSITVQEELEKAIQVYCHSLQKKSPKNPEIDVDVNSEIEKIKITASGRTDKGVHAKAQVVSFVWPNGLPLSGFQFVNSVNALTPEGITLRGVEEVPENFDARFSPHIKSYSYTILNTAYPSALRDDFCWHIRHKLDIARMMKASKHIIGQHDFNGFRAANCCSKTTIRTILDSNIVRINGEQLEYRIIGKGFLKQMVRIIVGTLVEIGKGEKEPETILKILSTKNRKYAGKTAPAKGLCLEWVKYL